MTSPDFHPLDAYSVDELFEAIDRRCFGTFLACIPRRQSGDGVDTWLNVRWHDYRVLDLIGVVELCKAKLMREAQAASSVTPTNPDDRGDGDAAP